jgi:hypothetical protein
VSRHWKPDGNVTRGDFGRRVRTRSREAGTAWLSPEAYRALSPEERLRLYAKRSLERHERTFRPTPARYRKGHYARQRWSWLAAVMVFGLAVTQFNFAVPDFVDASAASAPVTASFSYCKWGSARLQRSSLCISPPSAGSKTPRNAVRETIGGSLQLPANWS